MKSENQFSDVLKALSAQYRQGLPAAIERIEDLWHSLETGPATAQHMHELHRRLHSLAGSGDTFGVALLSDAAAAAEAYIEPFVQSVRIPETSQRTDFERLLARVRSAALGG